jgi:wyosine [tRNA(Phe)-imidazoG37] synthetase (radical SAM superfamily)
VNRKETTGNSSRPAELRAFADHAREWRANRYVYPVISRRSHGLSIGVNLNPDTACNFDCVYCQVDRAKTPRVRRVEPAVLEQELDGMLTMAVGGTIFDDPSFVTVPGDLRRINDIAFSGDGEPTTCPVFPECVDIAVRLKAKHGLSDAKIVLITNAAYLTRPKVEAALETMMNNNGEIWAKLDAGTEEWFRVVNRANVSLAQVVKNITATARRYSITIQSLWMRLHGQAPPQREIEAFAERLAGILDAGGRIALVQVYSVARQTAEDYVEPLDRGDLERIAAHVRRRTGLPTATF